MRRNQPAPIKPTELNIDAKIISRGVDIIVNNEHFPITYPKDIWQAYSTKGQEILKDNLAYSTTLFLPQILDIAEINYQTARPLSEAFLFKNGFYDIPICAIVDGCSSVAYLKEFFNTQYKFFNQQVEIHSIIKFQGPAKKKRIVVIPFSFGKESLLSFSLAQELGWQPILVNFIEPANDFEYLHKKRLISRFERETGEKVYTVSYGPGIFRYGKYWGLSTELGWGLQTTEYAMMCLPFAAYFKADYIILGNEQTCNDFSFDSEKVLTFEAGYDQHHDWLPQQSLLISLMLGRKLPVVSFVGPLYEIAITKILHHRYPANGQFQVSCPADNEKARYNQWCQNCIKCSYVYSLLAAFNADSKNLGFTDNLFAKKYTHLYEYCFNDDPRALVYGSPEEGGLALYLAYLRGYRGYTIDRFKKELLKKIEDQKEDLIKKYLGIHSTQTVPQELRGKILNIYREELREFC